MLNAGIGAVVELADSEPMASLPRDLVRCRFPLADGSGNPAWLLRVAAETIATFLHAGVPTLVCCGSGMSRSVCLAAAGLSLADHRPLRETLAAVAAAGPADVSPALLADLQNTLG